MQKTKFYRGLIISEIVKCNDLDFLQFIYFLVTEAAKTN